MESTGGLVLTYSTNSLTTIITEEALGKYRWFRKPSNASAPRLRVLARSQQKQIVDSCRGRVNVVFPELSGDGIVYHLPEPTSLSWNFVNGLVRPLQTVELVRETGAVLSRLHETTVPEGVEGEADWVVQLRQWLREPSGGEDARLLAGELVARLGSDRWELLASWLNDLSPSLPSATLVLGVPQPSRVVGSNDGTGLLMSSGEVFLGWPEADLAFFLEALHTASEILPDWLWQRGETEVYPQLVEVFLAGYGDQYDKGALGRSMVLCRLSRLLRAVSHFGWTSHTTQQSSEMAGHVDDAGMRLLRW